MKFIEMQWQSELYDQEIRLRDEILRKPLGLDFSPEQLAAEKDELRFGVIDAERLIAIVLAKPLSESVVKLRQMAVAADRQGQGVGRFLIENVEQTLAEKGFRQVELHAREVAKGFYDSMGYVTQGERFVEVGIPHFKMAKRLSHDSPNR
ncbi:MAG: GNAT family N-acetyltransferase [Pirellulaceae bacterium]